MTRVKRVSAFLTRRPWVAFAIVVFLGWTMASGTAEFRVEASPPFWLIWVVVALVVYGALLGLVLVPRLVREAEWAVVPLQWASCLGSFQLAWAAWFLFGLPDWVLGVGSAITIGSLLVLVINGQNHGREGSSTNR